MRRRILLHRAIQAALWDHTVQLTISNPNAESYEFQVRELPDREHETNVSAIPVQIQALTIPELVQLSGFKRIGILKIDIEGAEKELFSSGFEDWLGLVDLLIIELHDNLRDGCSQAFYRALTHYEFSQFSKGENIFILFHKA